MSIFAPDHDHTKAERLTRHIEDRLTGAGVDHAEARAIAVGLAKALLARGLDLARDGEAPR